MAKPYLFYNGHDVIRCEYTLGDMSDNFAYLAGIVLTNHTKPTDPINPNIVERYSDRFRSADGMLYRYEDLSFQFARENIGTDTSILSLINRLRTRPLYTEFLYGIYLSAYRFGYVSGVDKPDTIPELFDEGVFRVVKQPRREVALRPSNQLKIFQSVLHERSTLLTGGTGVGKTRFVPMLVYYFSYLIETTVKAFNSAYQMRDVLVAIPRQLLIDDPVNGMLFMTGYVSPNSTDEPEYRYVLRGTSYTLEKASRPRTHIRRRNTFIVPKYQFVDVVASSPSKACEECNTRQKQKGKLCNTCFNQNENPIKPTLYIGTSQSLIPFVEKSRTVIVDEFHEHDTWSDLVYAQARQKKIKHIFMITATPESDKQRLKEIHSDLTEIDIPGIAFPINVIKYNPGRLDLFRLGTPINIHQTNYKKLEVQRVFQLLSSIVPTLNPNSCVIVFLTSQNECESFAKECRLRFRSGILVEPMYSGSYISKAYREVLPGKISILPSTNVVESSITIDQATHVIDCGRQIVINNGIPNEVYIAQSQQKQRRGRVGRVKPGTYYAMYDIDRISSTTLAKIDYEDISVLVVSMLYYNIDTSSLFYSMNASRIAKINETVARLISNRIIVGGSVMRNIYSVFCRYSAEPIEIISFVAENEDLQRLLELEPGDTSKMKDMIRSIPIDLKCKYPYRIGIVVSNSNGRLTYEIDNITYSNPYPGIDMSRLTPGTTLRFFDQKTFREITNL